MDPSWVISKYIPEKLYGFAIDPQTDRQVFFHMGVFRPGDLVFPDKAPLCRRGLCTWPSVSPPPILGEPVKVVLPDGVVWQEDKAPKATRVERLRAPTPLSGTVETFDTARGFGFVSGLDGTTYHLHKSEVLDGRMPLPGQPVMFFPGIRQDRPRACHIRVCTHGR